MQINTKRHLAETGLRPMVTAAVLAPAVPAAAQGGPPPSPLPTNVMHRQCADQEARFAARMAFLEAKIALRPEQRSEWEAFVARDRIVTVHAAMLQATHAAAARLKEKLAAGVSNIPASWCANLLLPDPPLPTMTVRCPRRLLCRRLRHPQPRSCGRGAGVDEGGDD